ASPKAAKTTSAIRLDVSTLPAATAAGRRALTSDPSGAATETGTKAPPEAGASGSVRQRTTKKQAERVTASGQFRLPSCCGDVPSKSSSSSSPSIVSVTRARGGVTGGGARDERDVRQVGTAGIRVVEDEDVRRPRLLCPHRGDGVRQRAEVDGDVLRLRDHPALRVEEGRRAVAALLD